MYVLHFIQILVLGYNQSNENDTKLAIDRYVEGTLTSKCLLYFKSKIFLSPFLLQARIKRTRTRTRKTPRAMPFLLTVTPVTMKLTLTRTTR